MGSFDQQWSNIVKLQNILKKKNIRDFELRTLFEKISSQNKNMLNLQIDFDF